MYQINLIIELIVTLLVYFFIHFALLVGLSRRFRQGYLFSQSIITINTIALIVVLLRLIFIAYPVIPFYEEYLIKLINAPLNYILPDWLNPFAGDKSLAGISTVMVNVFCALLFLYHTLTQFFFLKYRSVITFSIVFVSSLVAYIGSAVSVVAMHHLLQMIACYK